MINLKFIVSVASLGISENNVYCFSVLEEFVAFDGNKFVFIVKITDARFAESNFYVSFKGTAFNRVPKILSDILNGYVI